MPKQKVEELLGQAKTLAKQIAEAKRQKQTVLAELSEQFTEEEKQGLIKRATRTLADGKQVFEKAKTEWKSQQQMAREILAMAKYQHQALQKQVNHISIENHIASVKRNGFDREFKIDTRKANWQVDLRKQLETAGIGNGVARNICYKISTMI